MAKKAVIVLNGVLQEKNIDKYKNIINKANIFIAADGGEKLFARLNYLPHILIGDFDSLTEETLNYYQNRKTEIVKYPVEKDETDAELALLYCRDHAIGEIIFTNTLGGRIDHQLANLFLLEYAQNLSLKAVIEEPEKEIGIITDNIEFLNKKGTLFSILPLSENVENIKNYGFKYSLKGENLLRYKTRGISNIITSDKAGLSLDRGKLFYILNKK